MVQAVTNFAATQTRDQERIINAKGQQLARDGTKLCQGCPISNLAQEMSPLGKGFQKRIARIYDHWRQSIAAALENGIEHGTVRKDVSPHAVAALLVAADGRGAQHAG